MPFQKEKRLKFVSDKEKIIDKLEKLSTALFKYEGVEEKRIYFES